MRRFSPFSEVFDRRAFVMNLGLWSWDISPARPFPFHNRRGAVIHEKRPTIEHLR